MLKGFRFLKAAVAVLTVSAMLVSMRPSQGLAISPVTQRILDAAVAQRARATATGADHVTGMGAWRAIPDTKMELYLDPASLGFPAFTVGDIGSISYHTKNGGTQSNVDFSVEIYTMPQAADNDASWYQHRLTAEPMYSKSYNAPINTWNTWSTADGSNQLLFYDSYHGPHGTYTDPTLAEVQAGPINWSQYGGETTSIDYASQVVKYIKFGTSTGGSWSTFDGLIDAITITFGDGSSATVDLEASVVMAQDFGVMQFSGVNGYSVGLGLNGLTVGGLLGATVSLYKGTTLLAENTSKPALFSDFASLSALSSPFDIYGQYKDDYWNYGTWQGSPTDVPDRVVITASDRTGNIFTAEKNASPTGDPSLLNLVAAQDFGVVQFSGVNGYSVGFALLNGKTGADVQSAEISLYDAGDELLATNSSNQVFSNYPDATQFSSPFDVYGHYSDDNWTYGTWNGTAADVPAKAVIKVTDKAGNVYVATNTHLTGDPSGLGNLVQAQDFGVMQFSGVNGYSVGFQLLNGTTAGELAQATVSLYKGDVLLATNTATAKLLSGTIAQLSSPFDVFSNYTDGYWTYGKWQGTAADVPTRAVITVEDKLGNIATAETSNLTGDPSLLNLVAAQDFGVVQFSGVNGYSVGFALLNGKTGADVQSAEISLYDAGNGLLATNSSNQVFSNYPDATQFSSPFDVYGHYSDDNWTYGTWNGTAADVPAKAVIKVTDKAGNVYVATNTHLTGDPSGLVWTTEVDTPSVSVGSNQLTVAWTEPSTDIHWAEVRLYYRPVGGDEWTAVNPHVGWGQTTQVIGGLTNGTAYELKITTASPSGIESDGIVLDNAGLGYTPVSPGVGGGNGGGNLPVQPPVVAGSGSAEVNHDEGGKVESPDGSLTVELPAGAMDEDLTVTVAPVTDDQDMPHEGMVKVGNQMVEIVAEDAQGSAVHSFKMDLTLTFSYEAADLAPGTTAEDLAVFYYDETLKTWVAIPTVVDATSGKVTAKVNHLTIFALMAVNDFPRLDDIKGHWAESDILALVSTKVVSGAGNNQFLPDGQVTRAQFAKMIVGAMGYQPAANPQLTFADAAEIPDWAKGYVATAVEKGIINGLPGNRFGGDELITREQMAVMVARALQLQASGDTTFTDNGSISEWARGAVKAAGEKGIIGGMGDGTFAPAANATRAQAARMLLKLMRLHASN